VQIFSVPFPHPPYKSPIPTVAQSTRTMDRFYAPTSPEAQSFHRIRYVLPSRHRHRLSPFLQHRPLLGLGACLAHRDVSYSSHMLSRNTYSVLATPSLMGLYASYAALSRYDSGQDLYISPRSQSELFSTLRSYSFDAIHNLISQSRSAMQPGGYSRVRTILYFLCAPLRIIPIICRRVRLLRNQYHRFSPSKSTRRISSNFISALVPTTFPCNVLSLRPRARSRPKLTQRLLPNSVLCGYTLIPVIAICKSRP
jgi:hypothetical protein